MQATQLAERMAALREKEASRHDAFRAHVDPYMPAWMQAGLGLRLPPPLCEVNVRQEHGSLPAVTKEDAQLPPREAKQSKLAASIFGEPVSHPRTAPSKVLASVLLRSARGNPRERRKRLCQLDLFLPSSEAPGPGAQPARLLQPLLLGR
mmetsp:Transcript_19431/g.46352  ORF Transcript_19431/g.46352 Transcript_19431/m.46352 type:complete len:150 (+) Transcript_19431:1758-2207(+)